MLTTSFIIILKAITLFHYVYYNIKNMMFQILSKVKTAMKSFDGAAIYPNRFTRL